MHMRVEYRVGPELKFLANLDMMRLMERAIRRAGIPVILSQGFNPHLKLSMGTVLPVGLWGEREYFDLELEPIEPAEFKTKLNAALPTGIMLSDCQEIDHDAPALMKIINAAEYAFLTGTNQLILEGAAQQIMDQDAILVQSRGKNKRRQKDLRAGLYSIRVEPGQDKRVLVLMVSVNEPLNVRFDEIMDMLAVYGLPADSFVDFWRRGNYIKRGDQFFTPLEKEHE